MIGGYIGKAVGEPLLTGAVPASLFPSLFSNTTSIFTAVVSPGGVSAFPGLLTNTNSIFPHTVTYVNRTTSPLVTNTSSFFSPSIYGYAFITLDKLVNTTTIFQPWAHTLIFPPPTPRFLNVSVVYNPTVKRAINLNDGFKRMRVNRNGHTFFIK